MTESIVGQLKKEKRQNALLVEFIDNILKLQTNLVFYHEHFLHRPS